jgi:hypothetical protein
MVCSLSSEPVVLVLACLDESGEHEGASPESEHFEKIALLYAEVRRLTDDHPLVVDVFLGDLPRFLSGLRMGRLWVGLLSRLSLRSPSNAFNL